MKAITLAKVTLIASNAACFSLSAAAQTDPPDELNTLTVTGRSSDLQGDVDRDDIERSLATDLDDALRSQSNIRIGGSTANTQRLYLRGIEGSNLSITVDGARQGSNLFQHRGGLLRIDPQLLKAINVDAGPVAADAGAGALGGGVRLVTVDAQDLQQSGQTLGGFVKGTYGTADELKHGSIAAYGLMGEHAGLLAYFSTADNEDLRIGGGDEVPNSAGEDDSYLLKFSLLEKDGHSLRLKAEQHKNAGLYAWGAGDLPTEFYQEMYAQGRAGGEPARQELQRESYTLSYGWNPTSPLADVSVSVYRNDNELENFTHDTVYLTEGFGGDVRNVLRYRLGNTQHALTVGADYFSDEGSSRSGGTDVNNTTENLGLYLQDRIRGNRWLLSLGVRLDDYETDYGLQTVTGNEVSPNISGEVTLGGGVELFAAYGEAARGASTIPVGWAGRITDDAVIQGGDLDAERAQQTEGGLRYQARSAFRDNDQLDVELKVFDTQIEDMIAFTGGGGGKPVTEFYNLYGAFSSTGYEINLRWQYARYETRLGFSHTTLEDNNGDPVSVVRRLGAASGDTLVWDNRWMLSQALDVGYTLVAVGALDDLPEGEPDKPGYTTHAVQLGWQPPTLAGLTLSLVAENLLDKQYTDHTTLSRGDIRGIEEAGRNVKLAAQYRF